MERNIYDILNEVEIDLNEYSQEAFTDIEKRKIKNKLKKSNNKKTPIYKKCAVAVMVLLMVGLFTTHLGNNILAYANAIAYDIAHFLRIEKNLDAYKTVINKSITNDGITIQLNEVILDNDQLIVSATSTFDKKLEKDSRITSFSCVYVNGRNVSYGGHGSSKQTDDSTIEEVMVHSLENSLSGDLNIKVVFSDIRINEQTQEGTWVFEFKTSGDELALDTQQVLLDHTFTLENGQIISLEKYTSNNIGQKIYFSMDSKGTNYDMVLRGYDDLGNKIEFALSRISGSDGIFALETIYGNLNENAKELSLTFYAVKLPEHGGQLSHDFEQVGEAFTIDLLE